MNLTINHTNDNDPLRGPKDGIGYPPTEVEGLRRRTFRSALQPIARPFLQGNPEVATPMCRSTTDLGGPRRCVGDARIAYSRAAPRVASLERAEAELARALVPSAIPVEPPSEAVYESTKPAPLIVPSGVKAAHGAGSSVADGAGVGRQGWVALAGDQSSVGLRARRFAVAIAVVLRENLVAVTAAVDVAAHFFVGERCD
jgi:hypothetical protein